MCTHDRTYSPFRRTTPRHEQLETSSRQGITSHEHLSHHLVGRRSDPYRFRRDRRSRHRPYRHSGIGGDCRSIDRRGFTLVATDHASHYSTAPTLLTIALRRRRYVGGSRDHCHRIDRALRRCCLTVDTADDPHLGSDVSLPRRQSRVHTGTTMLAEKSPDTHQHRRCAASSAAGLQPTLGRSPVPMLAHELARSAERPLAIAVDDGRAAPRAYPRALPRRNRTSRSSRIRPMAQQRCSCR